MPVSQNFRIFIPNSSVQLHHRNPDVESAPQVHHAVMLMKWDIMIAACHHPDGHPKKAEI